MARHYIAQERGFYQNHTICSCRTLILVGMAGTPPCAAGMPLASRYWERERGADG